METQKQKNLPYCLFCKLLHFHTVEEAFQMTNPNKQDLKKQVLPKF